MRLLLDTHALIWWLTASPELSAEVTSAIADPTNDVFVSAASAWEIGIKKAVGKLHAPDDLEAQIGRHAFTPLPISLRHGLTAGTLPDHHRDPFDRMLVAQARCEHLAVVTRDTDIPRYGVEVLRA